MLSHGAEKGLTHDSVRYKLSDCLWLSSVKCVTSVRPISAVFNGDV